MMSKAIAKTSAAISIPVGRLAIAAIVSYQILLIVLIFLRPDLDPSWHTISEWAIGPYGWLMSAAFVISALSYAALFLMLTSQVQGTMGRIGMGILLICVAGALGAGVFKTDPMPIRPPLSTTGTLHVIFGTSQLMLLPFAALLINLSLARRNRRWASARRALLWTAGLPLLGFTAFALYSAIFVFPMGPQAYGPGVNIGWPPRFAFFTYMLWVVILAWQGIRSTVSAAHRGIQIALASSTSEGRFWVCSRRSANCVQMGPNRDLPAEAAVWSPFSKSFEYGSNLQLEAMHYGLLTGQEFTTMTKGFIPRLEIEIDLPAGSLVLAYS